MGIEKGGMGQLIFHCEFNSVAGSITHYTHEFDINTYHELPYLYAVCIATTSQK
ncbi:MAG: hypothetical protein ACI9JN_000982 [Bacteroidia bacterium]|jgi:hypothetical protein